MRAPFGAGPHSKEFFAVKYGINIRASLRHFESDAKYVIPALFILLPFQYEINNGTASARQGHKPKKGG